MPILTMTSDIGKRDYLVGAIKGQILQINDQFNIVDITHDLPPFNYPQTAYVCRNAFHNFPVDSFHLVLVNLFDTRLSHVLMVRYHDQYIGIADNGLITMILEEKPQEVVAIPLEQGRQKNVLHIASVFARAFTDLLSGVAFEKLGRTDVVIREKNALRPMLGSNWIDGQIIYIDHFENVVVNITRQEFESQRKGRSFKIVFRRDEVIDRISETYADVQNGEKVALFNAAGYLEIAINKGNAAGLFGLKGYAEKQEAAENQFFQSKLFYQSVRVYFE